MHWFAIVLVHVCKYQESSDKASMYVKTALTNLTHQVQIQHSLKKIVIGGSLPAHRNWCVAHLQNVVLEPLFTLQCCSPLLLFLHPGLEKEDQVEDEIWREGQC